MNRICCRLAATALVIAMSGAAFGQTQPSLPPGMQQNLPQGLPQGMPANPGAVTPGQAKAIYESLDPAQKAQLKQMAEQAKAQYGQDEGLKAQVKAWLKGWLGK